MPNHVTTILLMSPEVADALTRNYTDDEIASAYAEHAATKARVEAQGRTYDYPLKDMSGRIVDFAMVIPEPANMFHGGCDMKHPHRDADGNALECWYSWNIDNWGTKWGAYDHSIEPAPGDLCRVQFDTAWSHPVPVIAALAAKFPDEEISVVYADEDLGSNCGRYKIKGDETYDEYFPEYGDESLELAASVKYPGRTYAELRAEWDAEEIEWSQKYAFAKRLKEQRGLADESAALTVIREEGLEVPADIKAAIATREQADAYDEGTLAIEAGS